MNDALENRTSETEKKQIEHIILERERLVKEIYDLVFRLPVSDELVLVELRYINDLSVEEVCAEMHISQSTYFKRHKSALKKLTEMRLGK